MGPKVRHDFNSGGIRDRRHARRPGLIRDHGLWSQAKKGDGLPGPSSSSKGEAFADATGADLSPLIPR